MAVIVCFRAYVEGHEFTIITDHASLKWRISNSDLSSRVARWVLALQKYQFRIFHRKRSLNVVSDVLSRIKDEEVAATERRPGIMVDLNSEHFKSKDYLELIEQIEANQGKFKDLKTEAGYVYRRAEHCTGSVINDVYDWKLWVSKDLIADILYRAHDDPLSSHGGIHMLDHREDTIIVFLARFSTGCERLCELLRSV